MYGIAASCLFTWLSLLLGPAIGMYTIREEKNAINAQNRLLSRPTRSHAIL